MPIPQAPKAEVRFAQEQHHHHRRHGRNGSMKAYKKSSPDGGPTSISVPAPTHKPPSIFHSFKGDIKTQDIFAEVIESHRRRGQKFRILFPGSDRFEMERMDVWNHDSICTPCLILQPKTPSEVSSCIKGYTAGVRKCLKENRRTGIKLGIPRLCVAGGRNSYASLKEGAIVMDLARMRDVEVDAENRVVTVQGGARILDLDTALGEHGLMAIAGTYQNLGVVGCMLGGGVGYASRKHGLAADNLLAAEIVLADGRLKRCSAIKHEELFWALRGGGGGIGVVTSVTLRCFPLRNAALLTFDLYSPSVGARRKVLTNWAKWISGHSGINENHTATDSAENIGTPKEVYSQLVLPTNAANVAFIGTSIDPEVIPQSEARLEQFKDMTRKRGPIRRGPLGIFGGKVENRLPTSWDRVPGLADLKVDKLGASMRNNAHFRMVRYCDELQALAGKLMPPGNAFIACKYANCLTERIREILIQATIGEMSPHNGSRVFVTSAGSAINEIPSRESAFAHRDVNFVIFIEGRWNESDSESRDAREKQKIVNWVRWVSNQLHFCDGVHSTTHPESSRDQVSKSGRSEPPPGFYNFDETNGLNMTRIKKQRDPRNVFSLAPRISWRKESSAGAQMANRQPPLSTIESTNSIEPGGDDDDDYDDIKEGEVDAATCITEPEAEHGPYGPTRTMESFGDSVASSLSDYGKNDVVDSVDSLDHELSLHSKMSSSEEDQMPQKSTMMTTLVAAAADTIRRADSAVAGSISGDSTSADDGESDDGLRWSLAPVSLDETHYYEADDIKPAKIPSVDSSSSLKSDDDLLPAEI